MVLGTQELKHRYEKLLGDIFKDNATVRAIFDSVQAGISIATDTSCQEIIHNPVSARFFRINAWDSMSHSAPVQVPLKIFQGSKRLLPDELPIQRAAWYGEVICNKELDFVWEDGVRKTALMTADPIRNKSGNIIGAVATLQDITEQNKKILNKNQEITDILESITDGFISVDKDWCFTFVNHAGEEMVNRKRGDLLGKNLWDEFSETPPTFSQQYREAMLSGKPFRSEGFSSALNKWIRVNAFPSKNGLTFFIRDLTSQVKTNKQLKTYEERFHKAFYNSSCAKAILREKDNKFVDINKAFGDMTGYSREEVIGLSPFELNIWLEEKEEQTTLMQNFILQGSAGNAEIKVRTKQGKTKIALMSADIIEDNGEKFVLYVAQDITQLKDMEEEIRRLDRLNSIAEMAATISHEVRNPMTTVRGFLQLLKGKPHNKEDKDVFQLMIDELDRANDLLSVYLNLSKRSDPKKKKMKNLNKIINDLFPLLLSDAIKSDKNILLNQQPVPDLKLNKKELHQLILNLVRNGLEAMSPGGRLVLSTYMDKRGEVVLSIKDEGSGIPQAVLERIGTPFVSGKENGTGMGLAVCYGIAARHNAKIQVETGPAGTEFFIRFTTEENNRQGILFEKE